MKQLVYNAVKCLQCEETLVSRHLHDYVTCKCPNKAMADGGLSYGRYGAVDMRQIQNIYIYADDDFETVRRYAYRGSRGVDGKSPLTWVPLCKMTDSHLEAVLEYGGEEWHLELIRKEIEWRRNVKPVIKFNNGKGATICNDCRTIIETGIECEELYCKECIKRHDIIKRIP